MKAAFFGSGPAMANTEVRHQMSPARSLFPWKLLLLGIGLGTIVDLAGPASLKACFETLRLSDPASLLALFLALLVAIVWHEAGHLAAAVALDFQVLGGSLGPFRVEIGRGHKRFRVSRWRATGSISAIPRSSRRWRERMLVVIAGGPLATLALACASAVFICSSGHAGWMRTFLAALVQLNFLLFVLGLIPNSAASSVRNDARLFWEVWRDSDAAEQIRIWHQIMQLETSGMRPREYPSNIEHRYAPERYTPDLAVLCARAIIDWALDTGKLEAVDRSESRIMRILERCDPRIRNQALAQSAFLDIILRGDVDSARSKFAEVHFGSITPAYLSSRMKAAAFLAAGDIPQALAEIHSARQLLSTSLPRYEFELKLLHQLHQTAKSISFPLRAHRCAK